MISKVNQIYEQIFSKANGFSINIAIPAFGIELQIENKLNRATDGLTLKLQIYSLNSYKHKIPGIKLLAIA